MFGFLKKAAHWAGHAFHSVEHAASGIPFVGPGIHGVLDIVTGPTAFALDVANGERIDKAAFRNLKKQIQATQEVAPYVQTVVSFVPGVGTGVSGAIAAGLALSHGQPITKAIENAAVSSVPGGALGQIGARTAIGVMSGEKLDFRQVAGHIAEEAAKQYLGDAGKAVGRLSSAVIEGKKANARLLVATLTDALPTLQKLSEGIKVDTSALAKLDKLPKDIRKAIQIGIALGHAKTLQRIGEQAVVKNLPKLEKLGAKAVLSSPIFMKTRAEVQGKTGFDIGAALMAHTGVTPSQLQAARDKLSAVDRAGFDAALFTHIKAAHPLAVTSASVKLESGIVVDGSEQVEGTFQRLGDGKAFLVLKDGCIIRGHFRKVK